MAGRAGVSAKKERFLDVVVGRSETELERQVTLLERDKTYLEQALAVSLSNQQKLLSEGVRPPQAGLWQRIRSFFVGEEPTEGT